jgi:hypothetical protein
VDSCRGLKRSAAVFSAADFAFLRQRDTLLWRDPYLRAATSRRRLLKAPRGVVIDSADPFIIDRMLVVRSRKLKAELNPQTHWRVLFFNQIAELWETLDRFGSPTLEMVYINPQRRMMPRLPISAYAGWITKRDKRDQRITKPV